MFPAASAVPSEQRDRPQTVGIFLPSTRKKPGIPPVLPLCPSLIFLAASAVVSSEQQDHRRPARSFFPAPEKSLGSPFVRPWTAFSFVLQATFTCSHETSRGYVMIRRAH
ncbi:uncharacterized protein BDZ99DRAFT_153024 [Mytilinidion resinicola]|uniref:Uncharacterized protein n=1 Tax=Mytilinidion resinicola TaxID=574789 RepID=A0A6A6Y924_9PEZI|nr:uncharacterized protein BDZ99DRAFT_153024 [Mytilinidion resinicola]KAF2804464.1 hypothetical protein BDZ99DRAFT_153024 [Mytilinidion resinicola]